MTGMDLTVSVGSPALDFKLQIRAIPGSILLFPSYYYLP